VVDLERQSSFVEPVPTCCQLPLTSEGGFQFARRFVPRETQIASNLVPEYRRRLGPLDVFLLDVFLLGVFFQPLKARPADREPTT
jgi:hypothetical protein